MSDSVQWTALLLGMILGALFCGLLVHTVTKCAWEREAVERGHGEYYLDKDYARQWRWKPRVYKEEKDVENNED